MLRRTIGRSRRQIGGLACAAVLASSVIAGTSAGAAPMSEPPSTPVDTRPADGVLMSYVVNLKTSHINYGQTKKAEKIIRKSGGTVVQTWQDIGVIVVHSRKSSFVDGLATGANSPIQSAGQTRTTEVEEGTPTGTTSQPPGKDAKQLRAAGQRNGTFNSGNQDSRTDLAPDPLESEQWGNSAIKAPEAQQINSGSKNVLVGIVDTGVDGNHPDLKPNFRADKSVSCQNAGVPSRQNWQPTTSDHGTHVAGTIGASRNGVGTVGIAPKTSIAAIKVSNDGGFFYPEYVVCGAMWSAQQGFDVTNHSYYTDPWEFWCKDQTNQAPGMEAVKRAFDYATGRGVASVAAAGNSDLDLAHKTTDGSSPNDNDDLKTDRVINNGCNDIPTELPGVVTVSSLAKTKPGPTKSSFSNYGEGKIDVTAPGSSILSTVPDGKYGFKSGTSMASPHVAGVMALLKAANPKATPKQLVSKLQAQADPMPCDGDERCTGTEELNSFFGHGRVNALKAVTE